MIADWDSVLSMGSWFTGAAGVCVRAELPLRLVSDPDFLQS